MNTINSDFNKLILHKKKKFFVKKVFFVEHIKFSCFLKQNYVTNKKKLHTYYYNLFKQIENLFGRLPNVSHLNLKYTNKKKKLKTKLFFKISSKTLNKNVFYFLEILLVKYFYFYLKSIEALKFKEFNMLKETLNNILSSKLKISSKHLNFNILFFKSSLNFAKEDKAKKRILFRIKHSHLIDTDNIKLKIKLSTTYVSYFFKLFKIIVLNNLKINILMHKKFIKYKKILEKA